MTHTGKGIEIVTNNPRGCVLIQPDGVSISSTGRPVSSLSAITGTVYLVLDCSGSMSGNKIEQAKQGAINFAQDALRRGYSVGLIRFDSSAELVCKAVREISSLRQAVNILQVGDTTEMAKAINLTHANLRDSRGNRVMVVVTDGMPNGPVILKPA
jgi:Mg-chelatase subunit ChlD